jgi:hypothetical protein
MKPESALLAAVLFTASALSAAPLTATTAVHTQPDEASPTITVLKAGTEPTAVADSIATTPAGWMAIELPGPFEGYVANGDLLKSLDVRPGAPIRLEPADDSGVLATMEAGDKAKITGLHNKWTQISLEKKLTGYIRVGAAPSSAAPASPAPAPASAAEPAPAPASTAAGKPVPVFSSGDSAPMPRLFQGKLVSTRRPFHPRRPFDWALVDDAGKRIAYLDLSKLLLTEQIASYVDHTVVVYGPPMSSADRKDLVITVENLQLK